MSPGRQTAAADRLRQAAADYTGRSPPPAPEAWVTLAVPRPRQPRALRIAHFYCGPRREGDLQGWAEELARSRGLSVSVLSVDILHGSGGDLTDPEAVAQWRAWVRQGAVQALAGGPPCNTWTRARHHGDNAGPRGVRSATDLWGLPSLSAAEAAQVSAANALLLSLLLLVSEAAAAGGAAVVEHPATFWGEALPSIWRTALVRALLSLRSAELHWVDQCQVGLEHKGPTFLLAVGCPSLRRLVRDLPGHGRCDHGPRAHVALLGKGGGAWRTAAKRQYPPALGRLLAQALVDSLPPPCAGDVDLDQEALDDAALLPYVVPLLEGAGPPDLGEWRDLDSAGLRAARRGEGARAARKTAALDRIRAGVGLIDQVLRAAGAVVGGGATDVAPDPAEAARAGYTSPGPPEAWPAASAGRRTLRESEAGAGLASAP